jgi:DNA-binding IclR family transcriptional regulator
VGKKKSMTQNKMNSVKISKELEYGSAQKIIRILLGFLPSNPELGTMELSRQLGMNKSTVSRLIRVLEHYGFLEQDKETRKYSLGRTAAAIGVALDASQGDRLISLAQPYLENLRDKIKQSVCLEVITNGWAKSVAQAIGPPPLSVTFRDKMPVNVSAGARAILAFSAPEIVNSLIEDRELVARTPNTITDPEALKAQFKEIRFQGVAFDEGDDDVEIGAISAPIFNHKRYPVASVTIAFAFGRMEDEVKSVAILELKKTTALLSGCLYYSKD